MLHQRNNRGNSVEDLIDKGMIDLEHLHMLENAELMRNEKRGKPLKSVRFRMRGWL